MIEINFYAFSASETSEHLLLLWLCAVLFTEMTGTFYLKHLEKNAFKIHLLDILLKIQGFNNACNDVIINSSC